jgi:hypothetical protein
MDLQDILENLSDSLSNAGFDIAHIGNVDELSSALDNIGIDISGLGDYQMDLLLDALHHNGMTVANLGDTVPDAYAGETSAGDHHHDVSVVPKTLANTIFGAVVTGAASGLTDTAAKAVKDAYGGLNMLIKGYYQKHRKCR